MEIPTHINKKIELLLLLSVCRKYVVFESTPADTCHHIPILTVSNSHIDPDKEKSEQILQFI